MRVSDPGWAVAIAIGVVAIPSHWIDARRGLDAPPDLLSALTTQTIRRGPVAAAAEPTDTLITYANATYGFCFSLPVGWQGYSIVTGEWEGHATSSDSVNVVIDRGPLLSIRHPRWTSADPRQDIPVMVFTRAQWHSLQHDEFHVSAAPIGPSELGRNRRYVFALPPRFDFAFPTGYEEVEQILAGKPLRGDCAAPVSQP